MSLAQDRGRLEARIEVLGAELETQKKQNDRNTDALKIKTKIVDDQTETIRKLKEVDVPSHPFFVAFLFLPRFTENVLSTTFIVQGLARTWW